MSFGLGLSEETLGRVMKADAIAAGHRPALPPVVRANHPHKTARHNDQLCDTPPAELPTIFTAQDVARLCLCSETTAYKRIARWGDKRLVKAVVQDKAIRVKNWVKE